MSDTLVGAIPAGPTGPVPPFNLILRTEVMSRLAGHHGKVDPALLQAALDSLGEGITLADASGQILYSNPAADRILGRSATDAPPDEWAEHYGVFVPGTDRPFPTEAFPLIRALRGEETDEVEMLIRNIAIPDGVLISATGRPVRNSDGDIAGAAVVFRNVTTLRRVEGELRLALAELREVHGRGDPDPSGE